MLNWFLRDLWDDAITLTPEEKKRVKFGVIGRHAMHQSPWLVGFSILPGLLPYLLYISWGFSRDHFSTSGHYLAQATFITLAILLYFRVWRHIYSTHARRALRDLGYDICPHCGYWLRELPPIEEKPFCPECGSEREKLPDSATRIPRVITSERTEKIITAGSVVSENDEPEQDN